jgi:hypothetical protein
LLVVAVIVQVQGDTQVTNQVVLTVAIVVSLELQLIGLPASLGVNIAVSCSVCQTVVRLIELLFNSIAVAFGRDLYSVLNITIGI